MRLSGRLLARTLNPLAMSEEKGPNIAEKVRFWEEQDKINQALIPRVMEMHEAIVDVNKRTSDLSGQIAAAEARVLQRVRSQLQDTDNSAIATGGSVRLAAYTALVLAALACILSVYQLLS